MARYVVLDIGGTSLRSGVFDSATGALLDVERRPVESFLTNPGATPAQLVDKLLTQVSGHIHAHAARHEVAGVGISFPGPVNAEGVVHSAPTLWGSGLGGVPLRDLLQKRGLNVPVAVMNDISAAVYRYQPWFTEDFGVITISSGIGSKIFAAGQILLNAQGLGGELGHQRVVTGDDALPCDCGGRGHLGAITSGRGAERLAQAWATRHPERFRASALWKASEGEASRITSHALVAAIHQADGLAMDVLRFGQAHLASCLALLYNTMGVKRFVLIGGFCMAVGDIYLLELSRQMAEMDLFCLSDEERQAMLRLGERDDDHSLFGLGSYFLKQSRASPGA